VRKELNVVTNKTDHLLRAGFASFSIFLPIIFRVVEKSSGVRHCHEEKMFACPRLLTHPYDNV